MRVRLTPAFVAAAVAESGKDRSVYWDETLPCFGVMVTAGGHRSYVVQYRNAQGISRRKTIAGALSLDKARGEARKIVGDVARGIDPLAEERKKEHAARNTLRSVAEAFLAREGKRLRSIKQRRATFERVIFPALGSRPIDAIRRSEIVGWLDKVEDERGPGSAHQALTYLSRLFNWHASRDDEFRSPIVRGMGRINASERARTRVLSDDELRAMWKAASPTHPYRAMLRFILLTATRRDEAASMTRDELVNGNWTIPAARYKGKHDHLIPLSITALALLDSIPNVGRYVFAVSGTGPLGGFSNLKAAFDESCGVTGWRLHDLRRTARSLMSRAGVDADIAERCLGHVVGGVRGIYDRHEYRDEKLRAFEALAAQIERIVNPAAERRCDA
jgi:integrase